MGQKEVPPGREHIEEYRCFVESVAQGFEVPSAHKQDMVQEAMLALWETWLIRVDRTKPAQVQWSYLRACVSGTMLHWLRDHRYAVKFPETRFGKEQFCVLSLDDMMLQSSYKDQLNIMPSTERTALEDQVVDSITGRAAVSDLIKALQSKPMQQKAILKTALAEAGLCDDLPLSQRQSLHLARQVGRKILEKHRHADI